MICQLTELFAEFTFISVEQDGKGTSACSSNDACGLIVEMCALICCIAVPLSDHMWLRAIGAFQGWRAMDARRGHHILPISLRFQTTGPGGTTVGAANCEIN